MTTVNPQREAEPTASLRLATEIGASHGDGDAAAGDVRAGVPGERVCDGEVEPVRDFDAKGAAPVQKRDKATGLPMWQVSVHDADPNARGAAMLFELFRAISRKIPMAVS